MWVGGLAGDNSFVVGYSGFRLGCIVIFGNVEVIVKYPSGWSIFIAWVTFFLSASMFDIDMFFASIIGTVFGLIHHLQTRGRL